MFKEFLPDHVLCDDGRLFGELIPEFEVLIEFSPAFGDSGGDETEEVIEEGQDELIVVVGVVLEKSQLFMVDVVGEAVG